MSCTRKEVYIFHHHLIKNNLFGNENKSKNIFAIWNMYYLFWFNWDTN